MTTVDYTNAPLWLQWIIAVGVVIGFCIAVIRGIPQVWKIVSGFVNRINSLDYLDDLPRFMTTTAATLQAQDEQFEQTTKTLADQGAMLVIIKHEVLPNGGGSLRDDVTDIKQRLDADEAQIDEMTRPPIRKRTAKPKEIK